MLCKTVYYFSPESHIVGSKCICKTMRCGEDELYTRSLVSCMLITEHLRGTSHRRMPTTCREQQRISKRCLWETLAAADASPKPRLPEVLRAVIVLSLSHARKRCKKDIYIHTYIHTYLSIFVYIRTYVIGISNFAFLFFFFLRCGSCPLLALPPFCSKSTDRGKKMAGILTAFGLITFRALDHMSPDLKFIFKLYISRSLHERT